MHKGRQEILIFFFILNGTANLIIVLRFAYLVVFVS